MIWLVGILHGVVVAIWLTAGWEDCAMRAPVALLTSPEPEIEVMCYWGPKPTIGEPLDDYGTDT